MNVTIRDSVIGWGLYIKTKPSKRTLNRDIRVENCRLAGQNTSATFAPCAVGVNMEYTRPPYNGRRCGHYPCQLSDGWSDYGHDIDHKMRRVETSRSIPFGVQNLTISGLSMERAGDAVVCAFDFRGWDPSSTVRQVTLEHIRLRALVFGFSCNAYVGEGVVRNVTVTAPQQWTPCLAATHTKSADTSIITSATQPANTTTTTTHSTPVPMVVHCSNRDDCTADLQHALNTSSFVVVPNGTWSTRPLFVQSNQRIELQLGAELRAIAGGFTGSNDCLLTVSSRQNVTISTPSRGGARLRMLAPTSAREGGGVGVQDFAQQHVLRILNSTDVTVVNVSLLGASGDGMYIAGVRGKGLPPSPNQGSLRVRATNVLCANNSRNALSVIACVDCVFETCAFAHTRGAEPMAGVDLEPNGPVDSLHNITFRGCVSRDNGGGGFNIYTGKWIQTPPALPVNITFERCLVVGGDCDLVPNSPGCGGFIFDLLPPHLDGTITVRDSTVMHTPQPPFMLGGIGASGVKLEVTNVLVYAPTNASVSPGAVAMVPGLAYVQGGVRVTNMTVVDPSARTAISVTKFNSSLGVTDTSFDISVIGSAACQATQKAKAFLPQSVHSHVVCVDELVAPCLDRMDCRPELQAALDSGASTVIVGTGEHPITEPGLWPRSHTKLVLEPGCTVIAAKGAFVKAPTSLGPDIAAVDGLSMMVFKDVENVTVWGRGATIRMRKADYNSMAKYNPPSSSRMGLMLRNCSGVRIEGVNISDTGGDGIYIGRSEGQHACLTIKMQLDLFCAWR